MSVNKIQEAAVITLFAPGQITADRTESAVDIKDFHGSIKFHFVNRTPSGTSPTMTVKLQEADASTGATWTDIPDTAFAEGKFLPASDIGATATNVTRSMPVDSRKRYIRAMFDVGGSSPNFFTGLTGFGFQTAV